VSEAMKAPALFPAISATSLFNTRIPINEETIFESLSIKKENPATLVKNAPHKICVNRVIEGQLPIWTMPSFKSISTDFVYDQSSFNGNSPHGFTITSETIKIRISKKEYLYL
jgi:hypothetical protein